MKIFGLISLLITVGIAGWWLGSSVGPAPTAPASDGRSYEEIIESAREVVEQVESSDKGSVSNKKISVYDGITVPDDIRNLDLSNKNLEGSLKAEIRHLAKLEVLNLSGNNFTGLPAEVGQLSELRVLNLSGNPLTGLPHELANLNNLRVLDLRGTQYSEFDLNMIKAGLSHDIKILVD